MFDCMCDKCFNMMDTAKGSVCLAYLETGEEEPEHTCNPCIFKDKPCRYFDPM